MSVTLDRVVVDQFRAHAHAELEFPTAGLTTIIGDNGAGKSSLVSIAPFYALYGKAPSGVSLRSLRRQNAPEKEPTVVTVDLTVHGRKLSVTRTMKGKNLTSMAEVRLDGEPVTDTKTGAALDVIESLLGPADAFATVYLVAQKALDALVTAKGADRRRLIERLAGIDMLAAAVETARGQAREAKGAVSALPPVESEEVLAERAKVAADALAAAKTMLADTQVKVADAAAAVTAAEDRAQAAEAAVRSALTARIEVERARAQVTAAMTLVADVQARISELAPVADPGATRVDTGVLDQELAELRASYLTAKRTLDDIPDTVDELAVARWRDLAACCPTGEPVETGALRDTVATAASDVARLKGTLDALVDVCPTCGQATDAATMRASLAVEISAAQTELDQARKALTLADEWNEACATAAFVHGEHAAAEAAYTQALEGVKRRTELEADLARVTARAEVVKKDLAAGHERNAACDAYEAYVQARHALDVQLVNARAAEDAARADLDRLGPEPAVNEDEMTSAQAAVAAVRAAHAEALSTLQGAQAMYTTAAAASTSAADAINDAERARAAAQTIRDAHRIAAAVQDGLERFRAQRIADLAPSLQDAASDYINALSGGRFVGLELSDDFEASVIDDDGTVREVSLLSGGEESLVALALRLAIGDEVIDGSGSMLVLDEILGAMDEGRRGLIVDALRRLDRQVVMVDHHGTPGDYTVRVERSR